MDKKNATYIAYRIVVCGCVQGVGYRYFSLQAALSYGIVGWARNLLNGNVEIHCEGRHTSIQLFIKKLWRGPSLSKVEYVECFPEKIHNYARFVIKN